MSEVKQTEMVIDRVIHDVIFLISTDHCSRGMVGRGGQIEKDLLKKEVEEIERERAQEVTIVS